MQLIGPFELNNLKPFKVRLFGHYQDDHGPLLTTIFGHLTQTSYHKLGLDRCRNVCEKKMGYYCPNNPH